MGVLFLEENEAWCENCKEIREHKHKFTARGGGFVRSEKGEDKTIKRLYITLNLGKKLKQLYVFSPSLYARIIMIVLNFLHLNHYRMIFFLMSCSE